MLRLVWVEWWRPNSGFARQGRGHPSLLGRRATPYRSLTPSFSPRTISDGVGQLAQILAELVCSKPKLTAVVTFAEIRVAWARRALRGLTLFAPVTGAGRASSDARLHSQSRVAGESGQATWGTIAEFSWRMAHLICAVWVAGTAESPRRRAGLIDRLQPRLAEAKLSQAGQAHSSPITSQTPSTSSSACSILSLSPPTLDCLLTLLLSSPIPVRLNWSRPVGFRARPVLGLTLAWIQSRTLLSHRAQGGPDCVTCSLNYSVDPELLCQEWSSPRARPPLMR